MTYQQLMEYAGKALMPLSAAPEGLPAPLVYVLETAKGSLYTVINDDYQRVLDTMEREKDTVVDRLIALWKGGVVDLPSYAFRKALGKLDEANVETGILLRTEGGYTEKRLKETVSS